MVWSLRALFVFFCLVSVCLFDEVAQASPVNEAILTVKTSPDSTRETKLSFINNKTFNSIARTKNRKPAQVIPISDTYLTLKKDGNQITYLVDQKGNVFDPSRNEIIEIPVKIKVKLIKISQNIRSAHYGKMVAWDQASRLIPKKTTFKVIDMETGLSFNVQRRAGNKHADVQPLTREDTAIMKQIYNGAWSWKRKAVLVQIEGQLLAASMHGMPHGGDGIPDNHFPGHFCIHFLGSSTHGNGKIDPEHQLMIHKAAGKLDEYLDAASPYEVANTFINALNLKETQIIKMCFVHTNQNQLDYFLEYKDRITGIRKMSSQVEKDTAGLIALEIPVQISLFQKGMREEKTIYMFQMKRVSLMEPWKIDSIGM